MNAPRGVQLRLDPFVCSPNVDGQIAQRPSRDQGGFLSFLYFHVLVRLHASSGCRGQWMQPGNSLDCKGMESGDGSRARAWKLPGQQGTQGAWGSHPPPAPSQRMWQGHPGQGGGQLQPSLLC